MNGEIYCHHCGEQILWVKTWPDASQSHFAHVRLVFNGKAHSVGNALMEQRCADKVHWATPRRLVKSVDIPLSSVTEPGDWREP